MLSYIVFEILTYRSDCGCKVPPPVLCDPLHEIGGENDLKDSHVTRSMYIQERKTKSSTKIRISCLTYEVSDSSKTFEFWLLSKV